MSLLHTKALYEAKAKTPMDQLLRGMTDQQLVEMTELLVQDSVIELVRRGYDVNIRVHVPANDSHDKTPITKVLLSKREEDAATQKNITTWK